MRPLFLSILFLLAQRASAQMIPLTFLNYPATYSKVTGVKVHEIKINPDSSFTYRSVPLIGCKPWYVWKGTWNKKEDTLLLTDNYELEEDNVRVNYQKDSSASFRIHFKTDKNVLLTPKTVYTRYYWDFGTRGEDSVVELNIGDMSTLVIPFSSIPHFDKLSAMAVEYPWNAKENRIAYLTENKFLNRKEVDIPNVINVEFVEIPKKEIVYRTTKCMIQKEKLIIISSTKTKSTLPERRREMLEFDPTYPLKK